MRAVQLSARACTQPPAPAKKPSVVSAPTSKQCKCATPPVPRAVPRPPEPPAQRLQEAARSTALVGTATAAAGALLAAAELALGVPTCCLIPTMVGQLESVGGQVANLAATGSLPEQFALFVAWARARASALAARQFNE